MKDYPSIPHLDDAKPVWGEPCVVFDKKDGSNLRAEYSPKRGWYKFGTRTRLFDRTDPDFGRAIDLFVAKYGDELPRRVKNKDGFIAFVEFLGPHSFSGIHCPVKLGVAHNDPKDVILFDLNVNKKGFLPPRQFLDATAGLHVPEVLYDGRLTEEFVEAVRGGVHHPAGGEGVIIKGGDTTHKLWMRKVKTRPYLAKLREWFGQDWAAHV